MLMSHQVSTPSDFLAVCQGAIEQHGSNAAVSHIVRAAVKPGTAWYADLMRTAAAGSALWPQQPAGKHHAAAAAAAMASAPVQYEQQLRSFQADQQLSLQFVGAPQQEQQEGRGSGSSSKEQKQHDGDGNNSSSSSSSSAGGPKSSQPSADAAAAAAAAGEEPMVLCDLLLVFTLPSPVADCTDPLLQQQHKEDRCSTTFWQQLLPDLCSGSSSSGEGSGATMHGLLHVVDPAKGLVLYHTNDYILVRGGARCPGGGGLLVPVPDTASQPAATTNRGGETKHNSLKKGSL
jgi:hypothetical protein